MKYKALSSPLIGSALNVDQSLCTTEGIDVGRPEPLESSFYGKKKSQGQSDMGAGHPGITYPFRKIVVGHGSETVLV